MSADSESNELLKDYSVPRYHQELDEERKVSSALALFELEMPALWLQFSLLKSHEVSLIGQVCKLKVQVQALEGLLLQYLSLMRDHMKKFTDAEVLTMQTGFAANFSVLIKGINELSEDSQCKTFIRKDMKKMVRFGSLLRSLIDEKLLTIKRDDNGLWVPEALFVYHEIYKIFVKLLRHLEGVDQRFALVYREVLSEGCERYLKCPKPDNPTYWQEILFYTGKYYDASFFG